MVKDDMQITQERHHEQHLMVPRMICHLNLSIPLGFFHCAAIISPSGAS